MHPITTGLLVLSIVSGAAFGADREAVDAAKQAYATKTAVAREALLAGFAEAAKVEATKGDLDAVKAIVVAKDAFEAKGTLPTDVPAMSGALKAYRDDESAARDEVAAAYRELLSELTGKAQFEEARKVGIELEAIEKGGAIGGGTGAAPKPPSDPVLAELAEAKEAYDEEYQALAEALLADLDERILDLSKSGKLDDVEAVQKARTDFESTGQIGETDDDKVRFAKAKFDRALSRHTRALTASYRRAITKYRRAGNGDGQRQLEAELTAWQADAGRPTGTSRVVNLIGTVDLARDADPSKKWLIQEGALVCVEGSLVPKVVFPYEPPEEYDFQMEFHQPKLRNEVGLIMPNGTGKSFYWALGGRDGVLKLRTAVAQQPFDQRIRGAFQPNVKYKTRVQVRRNQVRTYVNGKLIFEFKGDLGNLEVDGWHDIKQPSRLAVFADDPTAFHSVTVKEISGAGRMTNAD